MIENQVMLSKKSKPKFAKKTFAKASIAIGLTLCAAMGLLLWKFALPDRREYGIDLKDGYSLIVATPTEWTLDRHAYEYYLKTLKSAKPNQTSTTTYLPLQRSETNGFQNVLDGFLQRNVFVRPFPEMMLVECEQGLKRDSEDPETLRVKDFVAIQLQKRAFGATGVPMFQASKEDRHDSGLWLRQTMTPPPNGQKMMGKLLSQRKFTGINVYIVSPSGKLSIKIKVNANYPVELDGLISPAIEEVATRLKIVKTESLNR